MFFTLLRNNLFSDFQLPLLNQNAPASDLSAFPLKQQPLDPPLRAGMLHIISGWRFIGFRDKGMRTKMILYELSELRR